MSGGGGVDANGQPDLRTDFVINDQVRGYPTRSVECTVDPRELDELVRAGFLVRRGTLSPQLAAGLAAIVLELARSEQERPEAEYLPDQSIYIRALLDKDTAFHRLLRLEPALSIARSLLGPQVWVDLEARLNYQGRSGVAVPWHGHLPVIPDPLPPFFSYPHQIHCLIYLDEITELEGPLCLIPGSHMQSDLRIPLGDQNDQPGQVKLYFEPGDAVFIHANLWHRTIPSRPGAGYRRLLLLGYVPSWIKADVSRGVPAERPLTADLMRTADAETRELLGEFTW